MKRFKMDLEYFSFSFHGIIDLPLGAKDRVKIDVHFTALESSNYGVKTYCRNLLIGEGTVSGEPNRWIAEVIAYRSMCSPIKFEDESIPEN